MSALRNIPFYGQIVVMFLLLSVSAAPAAGGITTGAYPYATVTNLIRSRIVSYQTNRPLPPDAEGIFSPGTVEVFYANRNYAPAWYGGNGFADAEALIRAIRKSRDDGLVPGDYHLRLIEDLLGRAYIIREKDNFVDPGILVDLDILLSDSFFTLARHLSEGCVNPSTQEARWSFQADADLANLLADALGRHSVEETLRRLAPSIPGYVALRKALAGYRELEREGDLSPVPGGRLLREGMTSPRIREIREKLIFLGDLGGQPDNTGLLFDAGLEQAVTRFQERHGLKADGIVGPSTLEELNVPIEDRIKQLVVNLERMRWSSGARSGRYILVNVARFELDVVDNDKVVLTMKVVVGKPYLDTPLFTGKMTYLVLNPVWNVPDSIAKKEILPKVRKDPGYLKKEDITIIRGWGNGEEEIDPSSVDWRKVTARSLDFRFRQEPGPLNPLGRIKFMFPNKYNVYLHDTPAKNLFSKNIRTFSHGCIRIEKPLDLAEYLLKGDPKWTREDIEAAIEDGGTLEVRLPHPLNVSIVYVTSWVDKNGAAEFRKDVYGRDAELYEAITKDPLLPQTWKRPDVALGKGWHP